MAGGATSISVPRPAAAARRFSACHRYRTGSGVTRSSSICPAFPAEWTLVDQQRATSAGGSTRLMQATFRSFSAAAGPLHVQLLSGACPAEEAR